MYRVGQIFSAEDDRLAILVQTRAFEACMVCLSNGNRYMDPIKVGHPYTISEDEFLQITGGFEFKLLPSIQTGDLF